MSIKRLTCLQDEHVHNSFPGIRSLAINYMITQQIFKNKGKWTELPFRAQQSVIEGPCEKSINRSQS